MIKVKNDHFKDFYWKNRAQQILPEPGLIHVCWALQCVSLNFITPEIITPVIVSDFQLL